jgi:hypothetical protein
LGLWGTPWSPEPPAQGLRPPARRGGRRRRGVGSVRAPDNPTPTPPPPPVALPAPPPGAARDPGGATWQPWSDHVAYCALAALPWAGGDLATAAPGEFGGVLEAAERYMAARPCARDAALAPFLPDALPEDDAASAADSGGASFLGELWAAVRACQQEHDWAVASIPHGLATAFQQQLARGDDEEPPPPLKLPRLQVPSAPPLPPGAVPAGAAAPALAAAVRAHYPPRGGLVLLPREKVEGTRPAVERIVAEEYVLDSVAAYDGRRVELATLLVSRLPLPYDHTGVLIETLLGAMARLPAPALRPVAYHTLIMDVCKLARESPKYMAAWVRAVYDRMGALDPEVGCGGAGGGGGDAEVGQRGAVQCSAVQRSAGHARPWRRRDMGTSPRQHAQASAAPARLTRSLAPPPRPPSPSPQLRRRVADYLAHHLSNFQWLWGWERWQEVLSQPPSHPQRVFCSDVLQRMVALSYWEHLKDGWVQAVDPETQETRRIKKVRAGAAAGSFEWGNLRRACVPGRPWTARSLPRHRLAARPFDFLCPPAPPAAFSAAVSAA